MAEWYSTGSVRISILRNFVILEADVENLRQSYILAKGALLILFFFAKVHAVAACES